MQPMISPFGCFWQLLGKEIALMYKGLRSDLLDAFVVFMVGNVVFGYLFQAKEAFGPFMMLGSLTVYGLFRVAWQAMMLANDMEQERLGVQFVMPTSAAYVLSVRPIVWAINGLILMGAGLLAGKLILLDDFSLSQIAWHKLIPMMLTVQLLYGYFALWLSSLIGGLIQSRWLYPRLINPMFMFGCQFYTWYGLYQTYPIIGLLSLINPTVYCAEGVRASCLGAGYLPVGTCLAALWLFILFFFWDGTRRFKKKYDLL